MQHLKTVIIFFMVMAALSIPAQAAKPFAPKKIAPVRSAGGSAKSKIPAVVRFRGDRQAVLFSFSSFAGIESVNYSFTYTSNGKPEGAGGTVRAANSPTTERELLFGTCSSGVCNYHTNVKDARLVLTATFTNGSKTTRAFRFKV